jgi:hypothetical protein
LPFPRFAGKREARSAHRLSETAHGTKERFALVIFTDYEVRELAPYLGVRLTVGEPTWKRLDRASVEVLVGQRV